MKIITVSYPKLFAPSGTVYRQALRMDEGTFSDLEYELAKAAQRTPDIARKDRLLRAYEQKNNVYFLNLTQSEFIIEKILGTDYLQMDPKRASVYKNTAVIISV
jgi:hypothetical protein